jgi:hypothetical protein
MIMKFPYTFGTELTAIPTWFRHKKYRNTWGVAHLQLFDNQCGQLYGNRKYDGDSINSRLRTECVKRRISIHDAGVDSHCLEISSKRTKTLAELSSWSKRVRHLFEDLGCKPKHPEMVDGGAHIHVGISNISQRLEMFKDLIMRPYLPWIFGDPAEAGAMDIVINRFDKINEEIQFRLGRSNFSSAMSIDRELLNLLWNKNEIYWSTFDNKDLMVRLASHYETIEFRFFEMTNTWEEQELQIKFTNAYVRWFKENKFNKGKQIQLRFLTEKQLQAITKKDCLEQFDHLCCEIGLNTENYEPFICRNLYPRFEPGVIRR